MRIGLCLASIVLIAAGCANEADDRVGVESTPPTVESMRYTYPAAPVISGVSAQAATAVFEGIVQNLSLGGPITSGLDELVAVGDARHSWLISDLLRVSGDADERDSLVAAFVELTGVDPTDDPAFAQSPWKSVTDHLITWDLPAPRDYRQMKAGLFTIVEPGWAAFFADIDATIDWRWVSWGGVRIDDRPLGATEGCRRGCIPALDDPALTNAAGGDWYPDEAIVFGIINHDDAVALPKHIMEIHEMVNMNIGGRRFGIPYCTLCGAAQAYFTDRVPSGVEVPVLRTSGLLSRSNKVMYDLTTMSMFDTFTGAAVSGPLREAGVVLEQNTVTVTTWGEWKAARPDTRIIAEDGGIGRTYDLDPLRGRDDNGPIFPTGDVDPRLSVHEPVVGVIADDGSPVAFPADAARDTLTAGRQVVAAGIELFDDGDGLRARTADGTEAAAHEAFWFAWSQFHPGTELWSPD